MKAKNSHYQEAAAAFVKKVCAPATDGEAQRNQPKAYAGITINRPSRCTIVIGNPPPTRNTKRR